MQYIIDIFSPTTWNAFLNTSGTITGVARSSESRVAGKVNPGDIFICYLTGLSRWCGVLEVTSKPYSADTGLYNPEDPYVIRTEVKPLIRLQPELAIPIKDPEVWQNLSFTKNLAQGSGVWTGLFRQSHNTLLSADGGFLHGLLERQSSEQRSFPLSAEDKLKWGRGTSPKQAVVMPPTDPSSGEHQPTSVSDEPGEQTPDVRNSIRMQAKVAEIGATMGFSIWVPANDKARVLEHIPESMHHRFLNQLNLAYNEVTLRTIRHIDVLWLQGNAITRAFEIEDTTVIYSGLLRMADLLALQPNINISLHIVAPDERQGKVLEEIKRPVFSDTEMKLSLKCSFISYTKLNTLAALDNLQHTMHSVLSNYEVRA
ncbi:MAG: hypothetical protein OXL97_06510 [Chloroflexota bacterium]|nr:hypothetical protein [Chloroflexota bacterium]MDE2884376.1 hypothetical protein [Chloroflexota bacterium]